MADPAARLNAALQGRYRIERELGAGGMATVYLADDLKHERKVALKVLKPDLAAVVGAERFVAEIKATANLQHPHATISCRGSARRRISRSSKLLPEELSEAPPPRCRPSARDADP